MRILRRRGRQVSIDLIDDLDGTEAGETIFFELDGHTYEIDLSESNASDFRNALKPYIYRARDDRCTS
jgi:Lsr2